jgi:hypothetical protein
MTEPSEIQIECYDPVLSRVAFPLTATYYPMGFPVEISTNSPHVLAAAAESWGEESQAFDVPPARLSLGVSDSGAAGLPDAPRFRSRGHLMSIVSDAENSVVCDFRSDFAFGWVTKAAAADHPFLRLRFIESSILLMLTQRHLAPVHGALVANRGHGVLLCGDSFAGKSTLAYACARAGWTYVSDDAANLVRKHGDLYGIGNFQAIRLREDARRLFPELADRLAIRRPNGKFGIEVRTGDLPISVARGHAIEQMIFLNRREPGLARLLPRSKDSTIEWLEQFNSYGESSTCAEISQSYRRLVKGVQIREMRYRNLDDALACLEALIR